MYNINENHYAHVCAILFPNNIVIQNFQILKMSKFYNFNESNMLFKKKYFNNSDRKFPITRK